MKISTRNILKLLVLELTMFMVACAGERNREWDAQLTNYTPANINDIGKALFKKNGLNWDDYKMEFYYGADDIIQKSCDSWNEIDKHINGCNFGEENKVFMTTMVKDYCQILTHELIHQIHYIKTGDGDADHKDPQFDTKSLSDFCIGMDFFP